MLGAQPVLPSAQVGTGRKGRSKKVKGEGFFGDLLGDIPIIGNIAKGIGLGKAPRGRPRKVRGGMEEMPTGTLLTKEHSVQPKSGKVLAKPVAQKARYGSPPREQMIKPKDFKDSPPKVPKKGIKGGRVTPAGAGKKSSVRGQMISKIMKAKGMTLGQASKYLKEHPEGV
jgi:hypothetical protein